MIASTFFDSLTILEGLRGKDSINGDDLITVLTSMVHQIGNTHNYNAMGGILKSDDTSRFGSFPAAQSQAGVEETGINDYRTAADTRRYGFDLGFMTELTNQEFILKRSSTQKIPCFLTFITKIANRIGTSTLLRSSETLRRKHFAVFSLAHRLDRMDKCKKYIDAWVIAVGINPRSDKKQYMDMMSIIPRTWWSTAEKEVLSRRRPTMDRDQFKKEIAMKLQQGYNNGMEDERAHIIALSSELLHAQAKVTRDFFKIMFEELNSLPDNKELAIEYYQNAENMISSYLLTDQTHDILYLDDTEVADGGSRDVLATRTAQKVISKLRDMSAQAKVQRMEFGGDTLQMVPQLRMIRDTLKCKTFRFAPSGQQPWLIAQNGKIDPLTVPSDQVKMREGSNITPRQWGIILYSFIKFQDRFADLQTTFSEEWEKAHLKKALKEDEKREAAYIFADVQVSLGNRETICTFHYTWMGNNHKDIHCMYSPCYLHAWKSYEVSDPDDSEMSVMLKPGAKVHLNGECKLQQKYAKQLAESRHTFLFHDSDLNVVSQDGRVFEPAVHVTNQTQDAAPGRNSRSGAPATTFRRKRGNSNGSVTSHISGKSNQSYMSHNQVHRAQGNRRRSHSRGSQTSDSNTYYSSYSRFSTSPRRSSHGRNRRNGPLRRQANSRSTSRHSSSHRGGGSGNRQRRGRTSSKTSSYQQRSPSRGSSKSSDRGWHKSPRRSSQNRYSKDWSSAEISRHARGNRSPNRSPGRSNTRPRTPTRNHSPRRTLRDRSELQRPRRFRSKSPNQSGFRGRPSSSPRRDIINYVIILISMNGEISVLNKLVQDTHLHVIYHIYLALDYHYFKY